MPMSNIEVLLYNLYSVFLISAQQQHIQNSVVIKCRMNGDNYINQPTSLGDLDIHNTYIKKYNNFDHVVAVLIYNLKTNSKLEFLSPCIKRYLQINK